MPEFGKWWKDLKKHEKRLRHWLPHWRDMAARIANGRRLRYFTLCARPMIDVFMLLKEGLLDMDEENYAIGRVQFCECNQDHFNEIREMIAREDSGFFGELEAVVLFQDDDYTGQFPTMDSIAIALEDEGLDAARRDRLQLKRTFLNVRASFPYDCINLDFCEYYYPAPPNMLRVNQTVERFLDWQARLSTDSELVSVQEFALAVTCRYDNDFPPEAEARLSELIRANCTGSNAYKDRLESTRGTSQPEQWITIDRTDFFFAGWPKDIAASARDRGWKMEVLDYVHYERVGDSGTPYVIACLVAKFTRVHPPIDDVDTALFALESDNRQLIDEIDSNSERGKTLLANLCEIVDLRNEQATRKRHEALPSPSS